MIPFGRMLMSHLEADTLEELHEFAGRLGLRRSWFQDRSIPHYDISKSMREKAIRMGAIVEDCFAEDEDERRRARHQQKRRRQAQRERKRRLQAQRNVQ